ncbi:MAG TPA: hypothetical protein VHM90_01675, partial [Phycisphaerae bacterium]|nr:hypothetical protein [Phycisphaerae bacterium]
DKLIQLVANPPQVDRAGAAPPKHVAAKSFKAGEAVAVELAGAARFDSVRLMYRHFHQGERYVMAEMEKKGDVFSGAVPAAFTNSAFGIQYYFEVRGGGTAGMFPGFGRDFVGTPYFVVMPE